MKRLSLCLLCAEILLFAATHSPAQSFPAPATARSAIVWDLASLTLVQARGNYARIVRLPDRQLVCVYELNRQVCLSRSPDDGRTWSPPSQVAAWPDGALCNPELLLLHDGTLLCFYNQRPRHDRRLPDASPSHFGIALSLSPDGGSTWGPSATVFQAGTEPGTGCWEPAAVEVPVGATTEIQLFFANEQPYPRTNEQEISLLRSTDGGRTWTAPQAAVFRAHSRDGMPVPLLLRDNGGVVLAIEDPGFSGTFKPTVTFSDLATDWHGGPVPGRSPRRWGALTSPLPPATYAGAPYLRQMPTGETVLSFQQGDSAQNLRTARMAVCVGDPQARGFGSPSYPFPVTPGRGQLWNSLFVKDGRTITAVTSTVLNGVGGVWTMDGRLLPTPGVGSPSD